MLHIPDHIVMGSLCCIRRGDQILMLKRSREPQKGLWTMPGGKMEIGESPHECIVREIREETGLIISNPALRAIETIVDRAYPIQWQLFIFYTHEVNGEIARPVFEEGELRWVPIDQVENYERPYPDQQYWSHLMSEQPGIWQGKVVYETPGKVISTEHYT